ncbi:hypothetical protein BESB_055090 [Besnoitia besnoiti]|uniref:Uncharacterized protein n=1 Tax=Besnoitia besnoiti TaxID=94643 RepID=A0A2A9MBK3_BESBE|nr:hypothetical protein BESB_055090 [Besnoitia besnoiti]PFH35858.1 hypothetical protein BESB_055090 [Besnoitia besnoiti]
MKARDRRVVVVVSLWQCLRAVLLSLFYCLRSGKTNAPVVSSSPPSPAEPALSESPTQRLETSPSRTSFLLPPLVSNVLDGERDGAFPFSISIPALQLVSASFSSHERVAAEAPIVENDRIRPLEALLAHDPAYFRLRAQAEEKRRAEEKKREERKRKEKEEYEAAAPPMFNLDWSGGRLDLDAIIADDAKRGASWATKVLSGDVHKLLAKEAVELRSRIQFACNSYLQDLFRTARPAGGFRLPGTGGDPYWQMPAVRAFMYQQLTRERIKLSIPDSVLQKYVFRSEQLPWNASEKSKTTHQPRQEANPRRGSTLRHEMREREDL